MQTFSFDLIIKDLDVMSEDAAEAIYARCNDASASSSEGVARVGFDRDAESLHDAIAAAVADVGRAGYAVARIEIDGGEFARQAAMCI